MNMTELAHLSLADRLRAMDVLWASLAQDAAYEPSPAWHQEVVAHRLARLAAGQETLQPWNDAKRDIRAKIDARKAKLGGHQ